MRRVCGSTINTRGALQCVWLMMVLEHVLITKTWIYGIYLQYLNTLPSMACEIANNGDNEDVYPEHKGPGWIG